MDEKKGYSINRVHRLTIKWSRLILLDSLTRENHKKYLDCGWYYITRKWGNTEKALYIGKARGDIITRVLQHTEDDSNNAYLKKRGKKYVRIGTVCSPSINTKSKISSHYHLDRFLKTIESELIQFAHPISNISQDKTYTRWYKFCINNINIDRNLLSHIIENRDEINVIPNPDWWNGQLEDI